MEDVVPSANDRDVLSQLNDDAWGLEEIINPADESSRPTRAALGALRVKIRSDGIAVPRTPAEDIA